MKPDRNDKNLWIVLAVSLGIAAALCVSCWRMNFWPTDAEVYYMPAAKELPSLKYLSHIHQSLDEERIKWLHGKEIHVLAIACFQRLMGGDTDTLRPLVVLGVTCIFLSSLLIFCIARRLWDSRTGVWVWFLFASSFWPYLYILFVKHQTQGLFFFLLSLWVLLRAGGGYGVVIAGAAMAASVFSSTVSSMYLPFMCVALAAVACGPLQAPRTMPVCLRALARHGALFAAGFGVIVICATYPDVTGNLKSYWQYIGISGKFNHFFYNQRVLAQWIPDFHIKDTRGGIVWLLKYFFLIMPVLFPLYVISAGYLLKRFSVTAWWIVLSLCPVMLAEAKGVAQYGANYFPFLVGVLLVAGAAFFVFSNGPSWPRLRWAVPVVAAVQLLVNGYFFITDIYPCRMATTLISAFCDSRGVKALHTFRDHPLRRNVLDYLNPGTLKRLSLLPIDSVIQAQTGTVLLPPVSTDTIYRGSNGDYTDYDTDLVLNQIVRQGRLKDYALASFKTLGSSLIWSQEEEIMAYRYLVLNQFKGGDLSRAWLLDAERIQRDRGQLLPTADDLFLYRNHVRNIGTESRLGMYTGYEGMLAKPVVLKGVAARMFKMGNPQDSLRAFVFKVNDLQPLWEPCAPGFISQPVRAADLTSSAQGEAVVFPFNPPIAVGPGAFAIVIYRTGPPSNVHFTRIYADSMGRIEE